MSSAGRRRPFLVKTKVMGAPQKRQAVRLTYPWGVSVSLVTFRMGHFYSRLRLVVKMRGDRSEAPLSPVLRISGRIPQRPRRKAVFVTIRGSGSEKARRGVA